MPCAMQAKRTRGSRYASHRRRRSCRQRRTVLRAGDTHDALTRVAQTESRPAHRFRGCWHQALVDPQADVGFVTSRRCSPAWSPVVGRRVVVGRGNDGRHQARTTGELWAFEGLRAGDFVHQMPVDKSGPCHHLPDGPRGSAKTCRTGSAPFPESEKSGAGKRRELSHSVRRLRHSAGLAAPGNPLPQRAIAPQRAG